jgi:4-hydroxymandelate oxidase
VTDVTDVTDATELEAAAQACLPRDVFDYVSGGSEDESTMRANVAAWEQMELWPHVLRDVSHVSTETSILGRPVATPVVVSPTAMHRLLCADGELATARAAARAGAVYVLSMTATTSVEEVAAEVPDSRRWLQLYLQSDRGLTRELCERAAASGYEALCVTVDAPVVARLRRFEGGVFTVPPDLPLPNLDVRDPGWSDRVLGQLAATFSPAVTFDDLASFREWSGLPLVVKGVVRGAAARRCIDAGAAAVSVSNHGGRQLGHCVATARALPSVVDAVDGQGEVYVDGGVRSGLDVIKALALGAQAVLVGRPILWGLATGGEEGVQGVLGDLTEQLARTLAYCGATHPGEVTRDLLGPFPLGGRRP